MTEKDEFAAEIEKLWNDEIENSDISGMRIEELHALIHELTARRLVEKLRDPEATTAGILQQARSFLKDNEVTGLDIPGMAQEALRNKLNERAPFRLTGDTA